MLAAAASSLALVALCASHARARRAETRSGAASLGLEIPPIVVAFLPTGTQRDVLRAA
jgi:hypothetical protein